jgi:hypothetical protein
MSTTPSKSNSKPTVAPKSIEHHSSNIHDSDKDIIRVRRE